MFFGVGAGTGGRGEKEGYQYLKKGGCVQSGQHFRGLLDPAVELLHGHACPVEAQEVAIEPVQLIGHIHKKGVVLLRREFGRPKLVHQ